MEGYLRVGELARRAGVSARTVRYYEQVGLLPAPRRSQAGYRLYRGDDVGRLLFIRQAKALGLSLEEVRQVLDLYDARDSPCVHVLGLLESRLQELTALIRELTELKAALERLRDQWKAGVHDEEAEGHICPIIQRAERAVPSRGLRWLTAALRPRAADDGDN